MEQSVFVPATIGNVGPGFDCLGLCVEGLGDTLVGRASSKTSIGRVTGRQAEQVPLDPDKNSAAIAAATFFRLVGYTDGIEIDIHRKLPLSGGLGASAAAAVGGAMLAARLTGSENETEKILAASLAGETQVAGRHLDNIAPCYFGGVVIVLSCDPICVIQVPVKARWWLSVLTPAQALNTKDARKVLPESLAMAAWVAQSAHTAALVQAFITGEAELFRKAFVDRFAEPLRAPLISRFQEVRDAALGAGALGCTISGGGPSIFAVSECEADAIVVSESMMQAAGPHAVSHTGALSFQGARVI